MGLNVKSSSLKAAILFLAMIMLPNTSRKWLASVLIHQEVHSTPVPMKQTLNVSDMQADLFRLKKAACVYETLVLYSTQ